MKKIILVMSIFLGIFSGTTAFATDQKSDGIDIVNIMLDKYTAMDKVYNNNFKDKKETPEKMMQKVSNYIKELEVFKKDLSIAKKNASKTVIENRVDDFNKVLNKFDDLVDVQLSLANFALGMIKSKETNNSMTAKESNDLNEIVKRMDKVEKEFVNSLEEFMGTTGITLSPESNEVEILNGFIEKYVTIENNHISIFADDNLSFKERARQCSDYIKELENFKKNINIAKENSLNNIVEDKVEAFNKVLENFSNMIEDEVYLINLVLELCKEERSPDKLTKEQESKFNEISLKLVESAKIFSTSLEEFMR